MIFDTSATDVSSWGKILLILSHYRNQIKQDFSQILSSFAYKNPRIYRGICFANFIFFKASSIQMIPFSSSKSTLLLQK
jgi:hypothetical protein